MAKTYEVRVEGFMTNGAMVGTVALVIAESREEAIEMIREKISQGRFDVLEYTWRTKRLEPQMIPSILVEQKSNRLWPVEV